MEEEGVSNIHQKSLLSGSTNLVLRDELPVRFQFAHDQNFVNYNHSWVVEVWALDIGVVNVQE